MVILRGPESVPLVKTPNQPTTNTMTYIVAGGNAYIIDSINGTPYGAPVNTDGTIDWDCTFDFDPRMDEDLMIQTNQILHTLKQLAQLTS